MIFQTLERREGLRPFQPYKKTTKKGRKTRPFFIPTEATVAGHRLRFFRLMGA
jgi:hypothetical protein